MLMLNVGNAPSELVVKRTARAMMIAAETDAGELFL